MTTSKNIAGVWALSAIALAAVPPAVSRAADGERDMKATHCVRVGDIERIDVINDRTLLFEMRGGESLRNDLPHDCPGLTDDDTLMYRSSVGQLCSIDVVTVLEDWGFGFAPGVSCGLGMFHPVAHPPAGAEDEATDGTAPPR